MSKPIIPSCGPSTSPDQMYTMLASEGCLVVRDLAESSMMEQVRAELSASFSHVTVDKDDPEAFYILSLK